MDISIIVPIYNVEEYLLACLNSIKTNIEGLNAEVLLIDDGSTDNSSNIAQIFAQHEEKFRYFRTLNRGLSCARNYGASLASGKYLLFVDSDDLLVAGILRKMFYVAEANKTDLTICNVCKIKGESITSSPIHVRAFNNLVSNITHIKLHPVLAYDSTAWNKLILRSFYIANRFFFPEGYLFEDMPVVTRMHYCANAVSVIHSVGYLWRIRTGQSLSISQKYVEKKNLTDKIEMIKKLLDYVNHDVPEKQIKKAVMSKILNVDFEGYYDRLHIMKTEQAQEYVDLLSDFLEHYIDKDAFDCLPLKYQQLYQDLLKKDLDHLLRVINYKNVNYSRAPILKKDKKYYMMLPQEIFTIPSRSIDYEFSEVPPNCYLDFVHISRFKVSLKGHIYFRRISIFPKEQKVETELINDVTGISCRLNTEVINSFYQTEEQGAILNYDDYRYYYNNYDGTGFQIDIDFERFSYTPKWNGENFIILNYDNRIKKGSRFLTGVRSAARKSLEAFSYKNEEFMIRFMFDKQNAILIVITPLKKND